MGLLENCLYYSKEGSLLWGGGGGNEFCVLIKHYILCGKVVGTRPRHMEWFISG